MAQEFVRFGHASRANHEDTIQRLKVQTRRKHGGTNASLHEIATRLSADLSGCTDADKS